MKEKILRVGYGAISSITKNADGTLLVRGKATDDSLDSDGQKCDMGWLNEAMPKWFATGANVREMHGGIAAGVGIELESKSDGHYITAKVVDTGSVKKVEEEVLKMFSIGIKGAQIIKDASAPNGRIVGGRIVEVSLVDRGSNFGSSFEKLTLVKADGDGNAEFTEELDDAAVDEVEAPVEVVVEKPADAVIEPVVPPVEKTIEPAHTPTAEELEDLGKPAETETEKPAETVVDEAKSMTAEWLVNRVRALNKAGKIEKGDFNQADFDKTREGLAGLIASEAGDLKEGEDESSSMRYLMDCLSALFGWKQNESWELPTMSMSAEADLTKSLNDPTLVALIEKAVKSATESVVTEFEVLKTANASVTEELEVTKAALAEANGKAAISSVKRANVNKGEQVTSDDVQSQVRELHAKADGIRGEDRELAESYEIRARKLLEKTDK